MRGCFIVFEGIDGSGKTLQFKRLVNNLNKEYKVVPTKEPTTNRPVGNLIRRILHKDTEIAEEALALLFAADRADHTVNKIKPALEQGAVVVSDRYVHSSLAYQSKGMIEELEIKWIKDINKFAIHPDIVIFLDISPETSQKRLSNGQIRMQDHTYFEKTVQQEKIRSAYYEILNLDRPEEKLLEYQKRGKKKKDEDFEIVGTRNKTSVLRIDGTLTENQIEKIIYDYVKRYLETQKVPKKTNRLKEKDLTSFTMEGN